MIIEFETDCWKCSKMHPQVANSEQQFVDIVTGMGSWLPTIRITAIEKAGGERVEIFPSEKSTVVLPVIDTLKSAAEEGLDNE